VLVYRAYFAKAPKEGYGRYKTVRLDTTPPDRPAIDEAFMVPFGGAAPAVKNALLIRRVYAHVWDNTGGPGRGLPGLLRPRPVQSHGPPCTAEPLTREAYHNSRWIAEPLPSVRLLPGEWTVACAVIVGAASRAVDQPQPPAYILAGGHRDGGGRRDRLVQ